MQCKNKQARDSFVRSFVHSFSHHMASVEPSRKLMTLSIPAIPISKAVQVAVPAVLI